MTYQEKLTMIRYAAIGAIAAVVATAAFSFVRRNQESPAILLPSSSSDTQQGVSSAYRGGHYETIPITNEDSDSRTEELIREMIGRLDNERAYWEWRLEQIQSPRHDGSPPSDVKNVDYNVFDTLQPDSATPNRRDFQ